MSKFYFTYGTSGHAFYGGWTEIEAPNRSLACTVFRMYHPDQTSGLLNCTSHYDEASFRNTRMFACGNFGFRCHEKITVTINREQMD